MSETTDEKLKWEAEIEDEISRPKQKKSGMLTLRSGESLFSDGDLANSLYIIQKGRIRLFKPKGKGVVELAILRAGEVLGEMGYFDKDDLSSGGRRSCSAEAIIETEVIEISFAAFGKTMTKLNPWFKTIVDTLVSRLKRSNLKVKELEDNNVSNYRGEYLFLRNQDVIRILSSIYLVINTYGEYEGENSRVHLNTLKLYICEIYGIQEVKLEAFIELLAKLKYLTLDNDKNGMPKVVKINRLEQLKEIMIFINQQKNLANEKQIKVSFNCEKLLIALFEQVRTKESKNDRFDVNVTEAIMELKKEGFKVEQSDLDDAVEVGLCGDVVVDDETLVCQVRKGELAKYLPGIIFQNSVSKLNQSKDPAKKKY